MFRLVALHWISGIEEVDFALFSDFFQINFLTKEKESGRGNEIIPNVNFGRKSDKMLLVHFLLGSP